MQLKKGYVVKVGLVFFKIVNIEDLHFKEAITLTAGETKKLKVEKLKPLIDELLVINKIGINGGVEIQLFFPSEIPRGTPKGLDIKLDRHQASYLNPREINFTIKQNVEATLNVTNPYSTSIDADLWFYGLKLRVVPHIHAEGEVFTELLDYSSAVA